MNRTPNLPAVAHARSLASSGAAQSIRIAAGLSLREVAAELDVSPSTVLRWERAERVPRASAAERYGHLLDDLMRSRP